MGDISPAEKKLYREELEELSEMTLELVETYLSDMDLEDDMMEDSFMWGGGNLRPDESKSYTDWLKHYGVDDDEDED